MYPTVFFFVLTQKRNKKSQGCRKKAKIYFIALQWMKSKALLLFHDLTKQRFNF